ncbi:carboxymuconolactone decarboxylase family protein [Acidithrix sp. C25]|uniref:carboxymuconolactone decarboxylase family protein n=1 Tax=Acidithrix sp. C25 TaxID=1671482 RepID=UPI00191BC948|nr:carboxymuconolactone decarboxylase family protein [Acidithrix sp. C25]CAG4925167.1 unnamed protein product [Acidithrix sp. C25]
MDESHGHYQSLSRDLSLPAKELRALTPDVWKGFADLSRAAMAEGELPAKYKELIALSIAIARECDGCISSHARGAARKGVTPQEVAEMVGVTILMLGGPGTVYGPRAWQAFNEFYTPQVDEG